MKKLSLLFLTLIMILVSCQVSSHEKPEPAPYSVLSSCPDTSFIGTWRSVETGKYLNDVGQYEYEYTTTLQFDDNNQMKMIINRKVLGKTSEDSVYILEWNIKPGYFVFKTWNTPYWLHYQYNKTDNYFIYIDIYGITRIYQRVIP